MATKRKRTPKKAESVGERRAFPGEHPASAIESQRLFLENYGHDGVPDQLKTTENKEAPYTEQLQTRPDGSVCPQGFSPEEMMPDGYPLPGRKRLEEERKGPECGYKFESHKKPFQVGPMTDTIVDGTAWAKDVNAYVANVSDGLPEMPMIACMIGGIGAGKTTALANLLSVYATPECFSEVHCFSSSMGLDPLMLTVQYLRNPAVKMEFHHELDFNFLKTLYDDVHKEYAEYAKMAKIGKFHKPESKSTVGQALVNALKDTHSVSHPYTDSAGMHHGEKLRLPQVSHPSASTHMSALQRRMHAANEASGVRMQTEYALRKSVVEAEKKLPFTKLFSCKDARLNLLEKLPEPRLTNEKDLATVALEMNVLDPDYNAVQARHELMKKHLETGQPKLELQKKKGKLLVFDDCAYAFHREGAEYFKKWITMIRHTHCAAIFCFQQVTSIHPIVRTCCTHLMLWRVLCAMEMKRLEDEWGGCVPDFLGAYHATTSREPDHEKDFLFVDLRKGVANRGFSGKVVPCESSRELQPKAKPGKRQRHSSESEEDKEEQKPKRT